MKCLSLVCTLVALLRCDGKSLTENAPSLWLRESNDSVESFAHRQLQDLPTLDEIILADPGLSTFATAFQMAMLDGVLCTVKGCNFTTFAPTNEAFVAFDQAFLAILLTPSWILHLQNLLTFHVTFPSETGNRILAADFTQEQVLDMLNSEVLTVNLLKRGITLTSPLTVGSDIIEADILASNGALNKIDEILSPGFFGVDVFALGDKYDEFTILQELIELIGLEGTKGEFTVLAPTNDAFLALGNETLEALREDTKALGKILANHVIVGVYPSIVLTDGLVLESLGGLNISVAISNSTVVPGATVVMFNDASVLLGDILAKNGIAHAIDMVLMDSDTLSDVPSEVPSDVPSDMPSTLQSDVPSEMPSDTPSALPSDVPSDAPSDMPSNIPSAIPSDSPSDSPSDVPSSMPSSTPSDVPSDMPSGIPSDSPSDMPSSAPSEVPSESPSESPSTFPSVTPSSAPSSSPTSKKKGMTERAGKTGATKNKGMEKARNLRALQ
jgi:uncharacterized surface protein with fasciclin (FAS1) repeats